MSTWSDTINLTITHTRQEEVKRRQAEILKIIEESKSYVTECDNLIKLRALKARCEKITVPRPPRPSRLKKPKKVEN